MVSDDEEQEEDQEEVLTPRSKKQKKEKEKKLKGTPPDDLRNIQPTEEEIESYLNRPRKKVVRAKETQAQKDARLALGKLVNYSSEVFYLDVRVIRRPTGSLVVEIDLLVMWNFWFRRFWCGGQFFPIKVIYVALGNVSLSLYFCIGQ
jgi:hypothetical protein